MSEIEMENTYDSCPVCHEAVMVYAVGNCDHPICYRCSTRMRTLCDQNYCPICRTDLNKVYMLHEVKKFKDIPQHGYLPNRKYKIFFQDNTIKEKFEKLLEHCCPKCKCKERTLKALQTHLSKHHTLFFCDLCVEHLKIFTSERKVYTRADLATHRRQGDKDDKSYKPHPLCQFCDVRYHDNDDLFRHLRKDHYFCHFCDTDGSQDYYSDYNDLREHFRHKHYLCEEEDCVNAQFINAFRSSIDYKAHVANEHAKTMSKLQAKHTRTIDVNIQLVPRNRRRDRGVIGGEDYEDVNHNPRSYSGRGQQNKHKEKFREADVERAIQASLSVMKEENMKKQEKPKKEQTTPEPVIEHTEKDFPSLGNIAVTSLKPNRSDSPIDSDHRDSDSERATHSMAKIIAKKSNQSVQHGSMGLNDFPSLHDDTPRLHSASLVVESRASNPVQNKKVYEKKVKVNSNLEEDFPGLPKSKPVPNNTSLWVKKPETNRPTPPVPKTFQVIMNNKTANQSVKKVKSDHPSAKQPSMNENEFPILGGSNTNSGNSSWLLQVNKPLPQKEKAKQMDWFDIENNTGFSAENLKGDKDNKQLIKESHSKNKKKKKKKPKTEVDSNELQSDYLTKEVENSTLDIIAFSLLSEAPCTKNSLDVEKPKEYKSIQDTEMKNDEYANSGKEIKDLSVTIDLANTAASSDKESAVCTDNKYAVLTVDAENENTLEKKESNRKCTNTFNVTEDFPSLSEAVEKVKNLDSFPNLTGSVKKSSKESRNLDDYPTLMSSTGKSTKAPPPGFGGTKLAKTPPGFGNHQSEKSLAGRPPPGFSTGTGSNDTSFGKSLSLKNIIPLAADLPQTLETDVFEYAQPEEFDTRNRKLIVNIKESTNKDLEKFEKFKLWSGEFRKGNLSAVEYFEKCETLVGKEKFGPIFTELLVLLPDISKQQDLLQAFKQSQQKPKDFVLSISSKSTEAPWKSKELSFQSCPTCKQVLILTDVSHHLAGHSQESDFPALGGQTTVSGPGMRAWLKAS